MGAVLVVAGMALAIGAGRLVGTRVRLEVDLHTFLQKDAGAGCFALGALIAGVSAPQLLAAPAEAVGGIGLGPSSWWPAGGRSPASGREVGGRGRFRTADLLGVDEALSRLSYAPGSRATGLTPVPPPSLR